MSRRGIQGFQKARLAQVLAARRLSQLDLARMVGVSPATISKWNSGSQSPESETLDRLASVVNVAPEWFTRPISDRTSLPLFRSNASAHVAARAKLEARLSWAQDIALGLEEFVDFPSLRIPTRSYTEPDEITSDEIERAACECRDLWRLGRVPVQDVAMAVEGAGVVLVREETGIAQIEGLSAWSGVLGRPLVLLSADKDNGYRSRFDLAHELGHLVLHRFIPRPTERGLHNELEKQAHRFAGAFLLPAESFASEVTTPVTLDDLVMLKRRWGVSVAAMMMRLKALELLDEESALLLFKRRSARWGGKSEPGDGDRQPERPRLLRRAVELLINENIMPVDAIARHFGLDAFDVESLVGLPEGYLKGTANVVSFARLKNSTETPSQTQSSGKVLQFPDRKLTR